MSLYNMVNGMNQATFFVLPMLGRHPDEYPRFRDCFAGKTERVIRKRKKPGQQKTQEQDLKEQWRRRKWLDELTNDEWTIARDFIDNYRKAKAKGKI